MRIHRRRQSRRPFSSPRSPAGGRPFIPDGDTLNATQRRECAADTPGQQPFPIFSDSSHGGVMHDVQGKDPPPCKDSLVREENGHKEAGISVHPQKRWCSCCHFQETGYAGNYIYAKKEHFTNISVTLLSLSGEVLHYRNIGKDHKIEQNARENVRPIENGENATFIENEENMCCCFWGYFDCSAIEDKIRMNGDDRELNPHKPSGNQSSVEYPIPNRENDPFPTPESNLTSLNGVSDCVFSDSLRLPCSVHFINHSSTFLLPLYMPPPPPILPPPPLFIPAFPLPPSPFPLSPFPSPALLQHPQPSVFQSFLCSLSSSHLPIPPPPLPPPPPLLPLPPPLRFFFPPSSASSR